jgi:hypothetical protein
VTLPAALALAAIFVAAGFGLGHLISYALRRLFGDLK